MMLFSRITNFCEVVLASYIEISESIKLLIAEVVSSDILY